MAPAGFQTDGKNTVPIPKCTDTVIHADTDDQNHQCNKQLVNTADGSGAAQLGIPSKQPLHVPGCREEIETGFFRRGAGIYSALPTA